MPRKINPLPLSIVAGFACLAFYALARHGFEFFEVTPNVYRRFWTDRYVLFVHLFFGSLSYFWGVFQLYTGGRKTFRRWHAWLGYLYFYSVLFSALPAFFLAYRTQHGPLVGVPLAVVGVLWLGATVIAMNKAFRRQHQSHQAWMARSLILGLTFLGFRALLNLTWFLPQFEQNQRFAAAIVLYVVGANIGYELIRARRAKTIRPI